jgi:hypothetical protein
MSHNSNFQGLIRRFSDNPPSVEYEEVEWKYYEGDFIFFTILFYPLLILAIPIAYTGGVLEWGYYYLESAWNGDRTQMEYLDEMWDVISDELHILTSEAYSDFNLLLIIIRVFFTFINVEAVFSD